MDISSLKALLEQMKNLPQPRKTEANIFSSGARGHYENPVSDVLAFFLDPDGGHGLGLLAAEALFSCLRQADTFNAELSAAPQREVSTEKGNRIDILLEGDDWVMIIENKVWHLQNNPFDDYLTCLQQEAYQGKTPICVVLSPNGSAPEGWVGVSYRQLTCALSSRIGEAYMASSLNKWLVILREYVLHLELLVSHPAVTTETEAFILTNLQRIAEMEELKKTVIKTLSGECQRYLTEHFSDKGYEIKARLTNWYGFPVLRFKCSHWLSPSDVVLFLNGTVDEWFEVNTYACDLENEQMRERAIAMLNVEGCDDEYYEEANGKNIGFHSYHVPQETR
jgi:hypothetical protein